VYTVKVTSFSELFEKFKSGANENGELKKKEFLAVASAIFETDQHELLDAIFEYLDLDDSGAIDAGELLCALNIFCSGRAVDKCRVCFQAFDLDNNGSLSRAEFKNMLHTTLVTSRDLLIDLLGHFAEGDDPLHVETVTLHTLKVDEVEVMSDAAFDLADKNKDGKIELAEFESWAESQSNMIDFFATFDKLFGEQGPRDAKLKRNIGGATAVRAPTGDDVAVANEAKALIAAKAGVEAFDEFEVEAVRTQLVAGVNFFFKIRVAADKYVHARVFRDLPHNNSALTCHAVLKDMTKEAPLDYFQ
jgi:cystatin-A/B